MNKLFSVSYVFLSVFAVAVLAQQSDRGTSKGDILFTKARPTIYITFEGTGTVTPTATKLAADTTGQEAHEEKAKNGIRILRLRLHNNTRWAISFSTDSLYIGPNITPWRLGDGRPALGLRDGIQVNVQYQIEPERGAKVVEAPVINRGDVSSTSWLPPGRSIIFNVPREHLNKNLRLYVSFAYEWETAEHDYGTKEPEHRVYFRASDLPEKAQ